MNPNILSLYRIAQKSERNIIGLMSGTSLDGLDVAYCKISGSGTTTQVILLNFETIPYDDDTKLEIRKVFAKETIDFQHLALLNEWIGNLHGQMVLNCMKKWGITNADVDIIASHGQTVMHAPKSLHQKAKFPNATLQIGDGDHLAVTTQCITLSDFRQKHLAAGGEGAPLAVYGDYYLFSNTIENRILLNIGGISNFTLLPQSGLFEDVFVTDTGTGNTLMDTYTRKHFPELPFDVNAEKAKKGKWNKPLLNALKNNEFFSAPFPKSTGPELFNLTYLEEAIKESNTPHLSTYDVLATLTRFTAETIAEAITKVTRTKIKKNYTTKIYVSGGGLHNPLLISFLRELLPLKIESTEALGVNADAKEAILFALLANETISNHNNKNVSMNTIPNICMGKISFPQ